MCFRLIGFLWVAALIPRQSIPTCRLSQLDLFLGFDCEAPQRRAITQNNNEHERWRQIKERRVYQVRGEIGEETRRPPLDPVALGLRYAEIEAICREIDDREKQLVQTGTQPSLRFLIDSSPIGPVLMTPVGTT